MTSANSRKIQCEHHLVADLFVCGNFLVAGLFGDSPLNALVSLLLRVAKRREGNEFRAGPSRSETGGLTRRSADVKTDEEFLSDFAFFNRFSKA